MTDCQSNRMDLTGHGRRQVVADFLGGRLTTDAGVLLPREVDQALGLMRWSDNHGVSCVLGLAKNAVLKERIHALAEKAEEGYTQTGEKSLSAPPPDSALEKLGVLSA